MSSSLVTEDGPKAADKRKLVQQVKEGDARVAAADKNHLNSVDMLISAGRVYDEAKIYAHSIGVTWPAALELAGSPVSESMSKMCISFANAADPEEAVIAWRKRDVLAHREYRERIAVTPEQKAKVKVRADAAIRNLPPESHDVMATGEVANEKFGALEEWVAAPREIDPVEAIVLRIKELSTVDLKRLINELTSYARACGLVP